MDLPEDGLDLHGACRGGMAEAATTLLDRGAEVDALDADGWTALMLSCQEGHVETAEMLLERGAEVNLEDADAWTALTWASRCGHAKTAKLLLDRGAKLSLQTIEGLTALMLACEYGHVETAKLLLDHGAEVEGSAKDGWTALMLACWNGHPEVAEMLLDRGAKVDTQDANGKTALARTTTLESSHFKCAEMDRRFLCTITLLCMRSDHKSFADLGGPAALALARKNRFYSRAALLEFVSDSSALASYELPLQTLACFYTRDVLNPQAAADLSGTELYFMGLKDTEKRHEAMGRFRAPVVKQPGDETLDALTLKVERARDAHERGQDAIDCHLADLLSLLSSRNIRPAASDEFDVAMNTLREAKQRLRVLQAHVADDASLAGERDEARDQLAYLMAATTSGAFHYSIERLEKNFDAAAAENISRRVWASLSDETLWGNGGPKASDHDTELACQAPGVAIATWKQREKVIFARKEADAAAQAQRSEFETVKNAFEKELRVLRDDDPMNEVPLAEIRAALELVIRQHTEAREMELARCRAAAHAMKTEVDDLVRLCVDKASQASEKR